MSKTRSPGRFPEGKVGDSGRVPGRTFSYVTFSGPESVPCGSSGVLCGDSVFQVIARLPGRNPEGNPEGKSEKSALAAKGKEMKMGQARCSWSLFWEWVPNFDKLIKNIESRKVPGRESRGICIYVQHWLG